MSIEELLESARKSDLFFHYSHPSYDELFANREPGDYPMLDEVIQAIRHDAEAFCELQGGDPVWYVRDFLRRV